MSTAVATETVETPRGGIVDRCAARLEVILVTVFSVAMTAAVTLEIIRDAFKAPDSRLAKFMGIDVGHHLYPIINNYVSPGLLLLALFCFGWSSYSAHRKAQSKALSKTQAALAGFVVSAVGFASGLAVAEISSLWVCRLVLVVCCGFWAREIFIRSENESADLPVGLTKGLDLVALGLVLLSGWIFIGQLPAEQGYGWSLRFSLILLAWVGFIGSSLATRVQRHIQVDALGKLWRGDWQHAAKVFGLSLTVVFCLYMMVIGIDYVFGANGPYDSNERDPQTDLPAWTVMFAVVVAFGLMALRFAAEAVNRFRSESEPVSTTQLGVIIIGSVAFLAILPHLGMSIFFVLLGIWLLLFSTPLFVLIGALTALGFALFSDALVAQFTPILDGVVQWGPALKGTFSVDLYEPIRKLTNEPPLLAIPFFVLAGAIMSHGAIAQRLVNAAKAVFDGLPGGLGIATVAACMFFAAISGSSPVTVITIGAVMYPALVAAGYPTRFSNGLVTSAGTLGILIPPSIPMIVYAIIASSVTPIQVESLFIAGIGPGLLIGLLLSVFCLIVGLKKGETFRKPDLSALFQALREGIWSILLPVIILGGIYSGIFKNATQAAAVSVVYALLVEFFIHRELSLKSLPKVITESSVLLGSLLVIFGLAFCLNHLLSDLRVPEKAAAWFMSFELTPLTFLLVLNVFLLLVGCIMDIMSAILILVPLLAPMATYCGIDPIHLGIIFIVNLELGYLTPPMGLNLFVSSSLFKKPLGEVIRSVLPFTLVLATSVLLVTYLPAISLGPVAWFKGTDLSESIASKTSCEVPKSALAPVDDDQEEDEEAAKEKLKSAKSAQDILKKGPVSTSELMNSKEFQEAMFGDDDDDDEDDDDDDDDEEDEEVSPIGTPKPSQPVNP